MKIATKQPSLKTNPEILRHRWAIRDKVIQAKLRKIDAENGVYDYKPQVIPINIIKEKKRSYLIGLNIAIENSFRQLLP